ncbi:CD109 antigen-like [Rhinophrynus dorsalis]
MNLNVINLSNTILTEAQIYVLSRGLSFVPSNNFSLFDTIVDLNRFIRKLTLHKFFSRNSLPLDEDVFHNNGGSSSVDCSVNSEPEHHYISTGLSRVDNVLLDYEEQCCLMDLLDMRRTGAESSVVHTGFKFKSAFYPIQQRGPYIDLYQRLVECDLVELSRKVSRTSMYSNMSFMHRQALKSISDNRDIVVRNSDKGGSVVVLDARRYRDEAMRQLTSPEDYEELTCDPTKRFQVILRQLLQQGIDLDILSKEEFEYLYCEEPVIPIFHMLPKVHRTLVDPPGRPIVSGIGSLNEGLSGYVDEFLFPMVLELPSYLQDTRDVLRAFDGFLWKDTYLWVTLDVVALYSSILHTVGLGALDYWFTILGALPRVQQLYLLDCVKYLLHHNFFTFDGMFFLQKRGTSMGARFAPSYANLVMGWWERCHVFGEGSHQKCIKKYLRYVDDILMVWDGTEDDLLHFVKALNDNSYNLTFTLNFHKLNIHFLDLNLYVGEDGMVKTTMYYKPNAGNALLYATSCHPRSLIVNLPVGQFLRVRRNCSTVDDFEIHADVLRNKLKNRGYSLGDIERAYERAKYTPRQDLLISKKPRGRHSRNLSGKQDVPGFITKYSNNARQIQSIIKKHWRVLCQDEKLGSSRSQTVTSLLDMQVVVPVPSLERSMGFHSNPFIAFKKPSYYISVPPSIIPGANTTLAVHWFGQTYSEVTVTAQILQQRQPLVNASNVFQNDTIGILTLPAIPANSVSNSYEVKVNISAGNVLLFSKSVKLEMERKNVSVFIQTDKAVYKPGQTVKIRIISVNQDLRPHQGHVDIFVRDPQNNIVQQWLSMETDLGVVSAEFLLSANPMLGFWKIQTNTQSTYFSVQEYVTPKFEVTLNVPSFYIFPKQLNLSGTVMANYTYGRPLMGNVTISLNPFSYGFSNGITKAFDISGSANFSFTYAEISNVVTWGFINITATVTEELTGIEMSTTSYVKIEYSSYRLFIVSQPPAVSPGLNFTTKIQILRIDNSFLTNEERSNNISIIVTQSPIVYTLANDIKEDSSSSVMPTSNSDSVVLLQQTIPDSGIISINLPVIQSFQRITIEAVYQDTTQSWFLDNWYETMTYIQIQIPDSQIEVGTPFNVQVRTNPSVQGLYYVVMAKGMIVSTGKTSDTSFTLTPGRSWAPSAMIIAYFIYVNGNNSYIVQATQRIYVKGIFENKVSLAWSKNQAEPSENVSLAIHVSETRSLVGLRVVDISDKLLGGGNDLAARVENEFLSDGEALGYSITDGEVSYNNIPYVGFIPNMFKEEIILPDQFEIAFPETWIWLETNISSGLSSNLQVTVPDTLIGTSWLASAFVISEGLGLGVTNESVELKVFKPFFTSLNLPYSVTRGEQLIVEVIVFNYLSENLQVTVTLEPSALFDIIVPNNVTNTVAGQQNVVVPSQKAQTVLIPINPKQLGEIPITVKATSPSASHNVTQKVIVKAEGVQNFYSQSAILEAFGAVNVTVSRSLSFTFPADVVQGSQQAFVTVIGDLLGPSIDGLESLIQMPYGCGEQNMINFAPNIYILNYLIATNQATVTIITTATSFMEVGYQRELTYKRNDGSFSAFGNSDASGSTWLSAFVLRCFLQARPFIYISPEVLNQTIEWLVQYQDVNTGIFSEPGRVIHTELQGGLNGPISLTAYILTSLLEDPIYSNVYQSRVNRAVQYLESKFDEGISSNYTLSVVVYALSLANSTKAVPALTQLNSRANNIGGLKYWSSPSETTNYWQPLSRDIETAAYALLSHYKQNRISDGIPIMKWLSQQRNHLGGYSSTQDTVMALQALAKFMVAAPAGDTALTVSVTGSSPIVPRTFQINNQNLLVLQSQQIEISQPLSLNVTAVGRGLGICQLNVMYNQIASSRSRRSTMSEAFTLDVTVRDYSVERLSVKVCTSFKGPETESGMVLLEVGLLSGITLDPSGIPLSGSLKLVETKEDKVYLYFDSMTRDQVCVTVPMVRSSKIAGSKDAVIKIYDYYNPRNSATRTYNSETMRKISTCDFCGFNCTLCKSNVPVKPKPSSATSPKLFMLWFCILFIGFLL